MAEFEVVCEELDISAGKKFFLKNKVRLTLLEPNQKFGMLVVMLWYIWKMSLFVKT